MSGEQVAGRQREGRGQLFDDRDRRVARSALDVAHIGAMHAGAVGIIFLAPAMLGTEAAQIGREALADIHKGLKTALSTLDLQTISDIPVDFTGTSSMTVVTDRRHPGRRRQGVS